MMRSLLEDRFSLGVRREVRQTPTCPGLVLSRLLDVRLQELDLL